jgi:hypothetical protein
MTNPILIRLKFGSAPRNQWRRENPGDLAGALHVPASEP